MPQTPGKTLEGARPHWVDTHFHIAEDTAVADEIRAAADVGVMQLVAVAANLEDARRLARLAQAYPALYATVGLHPHDAAAYNGDLDAFRSLCGVPNVCAVGEIGLDYYYQHSDRCSQIQVFSTFLELAAQVALPAVIHCREAYDDCLTILKDTLDPGQPFEIHSCTGTVQWTEQILELGGYVSFNGMVTFKRADNVRRALRAVPLERLLLETDAPYLAPVPFRGKRNRPAHIPNIAAVVAVEKSVELAELAAVTTANARRFFRLQSPTIPAEARFS